MKLLKLILSITIMVGLSIEQITINAAPRGQYTNDTIYYNVDDHGVKGDGITDDLPALASLFSEVSKQTLPAKIIFNKDGIYRIAAHPNDFHSRMLLYRANNVVVEGNGCELMIHPSSRAFAVYRSTNVIIRNFKIDYSPLPYTQGRVTKVDPDNFYLEFKIEENYPLPIVGDESYYSGGKMVDCITANGQTKKFYQGHSWVKKVTSLGDKTYGVKYDLRNQEQLQIGDYFCMKISYPEPALLQNEDTDDNREKNEFIYTGTGSIMALNSDNLLIENIISFASPVMTMVLKGCSNHIVRNCSIKAKPGRIVAGCSDGIHMKGNEFQPVIEGSYFERTMDDAIHIKISGDDIKEILSPRKFRIGHKDILWDNTNLDVGKEIMLFDSKSLKQLAICNIVEYEAINSREGIVTIDQDIPDISLDVCVYLQGKGEAIIRNCEFGTQLQRGILTHQPTYVYGCTIIDNGKGFDLALLSGGIEGPPTQRLTVENCVFKNLSYVGLEINCSSLDYDQKGIPQLIIKKCTFDLPEKVPALKVKNSSGVSLIENIYYYKDKKPDYEFYMQLENTKIIQNENNVFKKK